METFKLYKVAKNLHALTPTEITCIRQTNNSYWEFGSKYSCLKETQYTSTFASEKGAIDFIEKLIKRKIQSAKDNLINAENLMVEFNQMYSK